jgi:hypothetical protein
MIRIYFRFYEELNDFLPAGRRKIPFPITISGNPSVKDAIESLGVPHVEVDLILVNGMSVDFSYKLKNEDSVSVFPVFESLDITSVTHLRSKPLREIKFILDVHLGKLAKYLRLFGFDTFYRKDYDDNEIIRLALSDKRIILTRDIDLLKNKLVTHGYWVRSQIPMKQLNEVIQRFDLKNEFRIFTRCIECNGLIDQVSKQEILPRLLPMTRRYYRKFFRCTDCDRIYWQGSHYKRMKEYVKDLMNELK